jgi:hypothetical protein
MKARYTFEPESLLRTMRVHVLPCLAATGLVMLIVGLVMGRLLWPREVRIPGPVVTTTATVTVTVTPKPSPTLAPTVAATPVIESASPSPEPVPEPSSATPDPVFSQSAPPSQESPLYLSDMSDASFIRTPQWTQVNDWGESPINGVDFPNSLSFKWHNCGGCTGNVEFRVPSGYARFTMVFGLSDDTRHDDVIDGVEFFRVTCSDGRELFPNTRVEYPEAVPVDVDITGCARLDIEVSGGTNFETFVLGDAAFS